MNSKIRWDKEREDAKKQRIVLIVEAAERVFSRKGLDKTTMQDIAAEAHMGVATVFRHFPKKDKIIVAVAVNIIESQTEAFDRIANLPGSSFEKLELALDTFIGFVGQEHSRNTKLIEAFESYAAQANEPLEDLSLYSDALERIRANLNQIVKDGFNDGSLRSDLPLEETVSTVIHAFGQFAKKLSLENSIPMLVPDIDPVKQLHILKQLLLDYLKV